MIDAWFAVNCSICAVPAGSSMVNFGWLQPYAASKSQPNPYGGLSADP